MALSFADRQVRFNPRCGYGDLTVVNSIHRQQLLSGMLQIAGA
jgi:hypothetical protein